MLGDEAERAPPEEGVLEHANLGAERNYIDARINKNGGERGLLEMRYWFIWKMCCCCCCYCCLFCWKVNRIRKWKFENVNPIWKGWKIIDKSEFVTKKRICLLIGYATVVDWIYLLSRMYFGLSIKNVIYFTFYFEFRVNVKRNCINPATMMSACSL